jgi:hypothetical protein
MNETPAPPPPELPSYSSQAPVAEPGIGHDPNDRVAITGAFAKVEAILRHPRRILFQLTQASPGATITGLVGCAVLFAAIYGVVMGSFSGGAQLWAAPLKVTAGLLVSALICLPSLYIFACLSGSRARLVEVIGLLAGLMALLTLLLIGFAPVAWIFSRSINSIPGMGFLHLLFWIVAFGFGLKFMQSGFVLLGIRTKAGIRIWSLIFLLVNLQMSTALRPLIGTSPELITSEKRFFVAHWLTCIAKTNTVEHTGDRPRPTP